MECKSAMALERRTLSALIVAVGMWWCLAPGTVTAAGDDVLEIRVAEGEHAQLMGKITSETYKAVTIDANIKGETKTLVIPIAKVLRVSHGTKSQLYAEALVRSDSKNYAAASQKFLDASKDAKAPDWIKAYGLFRGAECAFSAAGYAPEDKRKRFHDIAQKQHGLFLKTYPDHRFSPAAKIQRAVALLHLGRGKEAGQLLGAIEAAADYPTEIKVEARIWAGRALSDQKKHKEAIAQLQKVRAEIKKDHPALAYLAMFQEALALEAMNEPRKAERLFETVGREAPNEEMKARAFNRRGLSLLKRGNRREALFSFLRVVVLHFNVIQEYPKALYYAARAAREYYGNDKRAKELAERLYKEFPKSYWANKLKAETKL